MKDKLADMSLVLSKAGADAAVLAEPSSVSWVLNIRGGDVPFTPVVLAYAIIHKKGKAELFIEKNKLPEDVQAHLKSTATIRKPNEFETALKNLARKKSKVLIDAGSAPERVRTALKGAEIKEAMDPCTMPKACKNASELNGARAAQLRDGVALSRYLHWLSIEAPKGHLTEATAAERLTAFRKETGVLLDLSFSTISASGPNAAIPHYHVDPENCRAINNNEIYLIDSGGQYQDGTTDVTRNYYNWSAYGRNEGSFYARTKGHDRHFHHLLSQRHNGRSHRCFSARRIMESWIGFRPRHRPWRGLISISPRRPCPHQQGWQCGTPTRHDFIK